MSKAKSLSAQQSSALLSPDFNKKKFSITYSVPSSPFALELQNLGKQQCLGKKAWENPEKIKGWMISAETATFMKAGGLGMIASELPEAFNRKYSAQDENVTVVTPMYLGDTKKKKASFDGKIYHGAENKTIELKLYCELSVPFLNEDDEFVDYTTIVYTGICENTPYFFISNDRFFNIDPHKDNPPAQDGCYILNQFGINEVERFAFFSKAVYEFIKYTIKNNSQPTTIIANDWHSGALSGLMKYTPTALLNKNMSTFYSNPFAFFLAHFITFNRFCQ